MAMHGFESEMSKWKGYFNFQTKDLDNFLTNFYIEADGSFFWEKLNQEYVPSTDEQKKENRWNFGEMREISPPEKIEDTRTTYIEFYDLFEFKKERIFITFISHVKNGKLVEPISIKSIERTDLEKEAIERKKSQERWANIRSTWEWRMSSLIHELRWKTKRFFLPLFKQLDSLEQSLRDRANKKFPDEKDISNR